MADGALGERALPSQPAQPAQATRDTLIVALDLPTARIDRLKENLARIPASAEHPDAQRGSGDPRSRPLQVALVEGDLLRADASLFTNGSLPHEYDAVLLDAPCSNTGVMRHRVDVRWRLQPNDFTKHARQQLALLEAAARRVAPGGRLVYSTCSIDAEENERVVETFLKNANARSGGGSDNDGGGRGDGNGKFTMDKSIIARPWDTGHDGAGAFLLRRVA